MHVSCALHVLYETINHLQELLGTNTGKLEAGCGKKRRRIRFGTSTEKLRRAGKIRASQKQKASSIKQPQVAPEQNCNTELDCTAILHATAQLGVAGAISQIFLEMVESFASVLVPSSSCK